MPITFVLSVAQLADDQRAVVAAEAEAVGHGDGDIPFPRVVGRVIQVAERVGIFQVDRGRN